MTLLIQLDQRRQVKKNNSFIPKMDCLLLARNLFHSLIPGQVLIDGLSQAMSDLFSTGGLDLFATFDPKKCGKKIQHVAKRSNTWQKDPMPGKKSFVSIKQTGFETNVIE